ncbi:MAG TPA: thiamine diphosphokinase, partial [Spirochaetota bacterium]|nr:thiamine diphosphokinase [Spirochaetota bacterium]
PQRVIGDFDSITEETLAWCRKQSGCQVRHMPRQSDTDTEKCLDLLVREGVREIAFCGVFGDRLDHSLSNLALVLRWSDRVRLAVFSGESVLEVFRGECAFPSTKNALVSIYAFDPLVRITTRGLKYPLHGEPLVFGVRESTSNAASARSVRIQADGGPAFVVRQKSEVFLHGLLGSDT